MARKDPSFRPAEQPRSRRYHPLHPDGIRACRACPYRNRRTRGDDCCAAACTLAPMLLAWFDTAQAARSAASLVPEVTRWLPPSQVDWSSKKAVERLSRMTDVLSDQLRGFGQSQRLHVSKRAGLGN